MGADASESGTLEGELAADAFKTDSSMDKNGDGICQYVVLEGEAGHQDSIVRTEYSVNTMAEKGVETEKLGYAIANWNRAQAQTKTAAMLTQFDNKIELIIANNDDMALGAIDALKASQIPKEEWPGVVGIDGTDVGLNAVKNEEMLGTVYNDKEGQAEAIRAVQQATADGIRYIKEAGADQAVLQLKSLEAFQAAADGKANKIIIPSDIQGIAGLVKSISEIAAKEDTK